MTKDVILLLRQVLDKVGKKKVKCKVGKLKTDRMYFCSNKFVDLYLETN